MPRAEQKDHLCEQFGELTRLQIEHQEMGSEGQAARPSKNTIKNHNHRDVGIVQAMQCGTTVTDKTSTAPTLGHHLCKILGWSSLVA